MNFSWTSSSNGESGGFEWGKGASRDQSGFSSTFASSRGGKGNHIESSSRAITPNFFPYLLPVLCLPTCFTHEQYASVISTDVRKPFDRINKYTRAFFTRFRCGIEKRREEKERKGRKERKRGREEGKKKKWKKGIRIPPGLCTHRRRE